MIDLPATPRPASADPALLDFGAFLTPSLGGPVQRVNRPGSRFRISFTMPPMKNVSLGMQWVQRLIKGKSEGVRTTLPLMGFSPGSPGTVKVSGSGQSGMTLNIKGATAGYVFKEGQPFSIVTGSKNHLYYVAADTTASGTGTAALPLSIMLRRQHLDNDVCNFSAPMIEGFISGNEFSWNFAVANFVSLSFDITESQ